MHNITPHKWLFVDLNSYFASIEQQENPQLRGKPVAVVPMPTEYTCAIAASYEAKACGVKTGTRIREARQMCPNLICVPARHDIYVKYHNRLLEEFIKHAPINKVWSIDEWSCRLPPNKRDQQAVIDLACKIKCGIWDNVGEAINCSIGIAPNSLLAKIASDMKKPDGLTILHPQHLHDQLCTLKLTDLPGIGPGIEARLRRAGITTIDQLWNTSPKHARKIWGSVQGERFWYQLHGHDIGELETKGNNMIGHSRVLDPDLRKPEYARLIARQLLTKATARLRRKGFYAGKLSLGVRTIEDRKFRHEITLPNPANDPFTFLKNLDILWNTIMNELQHSNNPKFQNSNPQFKKLSTLLLDLKTKEEITFNLLDANHAQTIKDINKREKLTHAIDHLQTKYKRETIHLGTTPKTLSGYVGTKIAFSRVPEEEEFWE